MSLVDDPGGRSLAGIAGSNTATYRVVCLCERFLRRDDHPVQRSPNLYSVSDCVRLRNIDNEAFYVPEGLLSHRGKKKAWVGCHKILPQNKASRWVVPPFRLSEASKDDIFTPVLLQSLRLGNHLTTVGTT
jgi:hypothetical protein